MTSAARPTFDPARGGRGLKDDNPALGGGPPSLRYSSKDQPGHTKLKYRDKGETVSSETMEKLASLAVSKSITHEPSVYNEEPPNDDSEEDVDELLLELEKIKKEREEMEKKKHEEEIITGNPLLTSVLSSKDRDNVNFKIKPRWDEDIVFRESTDTVSPKKKQFINDIVRSEFHRKFMDKYIK